jgi:apolipoprotein N-acyltransferase
MLGIIPQDLVSYLVTVLLMVVVGILPYIADRLMAPRIDGFSSTLVFPMVFVSLEYLNSLTSPFGTWGALAYTQVDNLPLIQLVSIMGIWGVSFLMTWFASSANWVWEQNFEWSRTWRGVAIYGGILGATLAFGGARLTLFPPSSDTVQVAGIVSEFHDDLADEFSQVITHPGPNQDLDKFYQIASQSNDRLLEQSERAAKSGAKIVFWSEGASLVKKDEEQALIERGSTLARNEGIYLGMALGTILHHDFTLASEKKMLENKVILIDPSGAVMGEYLKAVPVPGSEAAMTVKGNQPPLVVETPYGKIAVAICFDADFPRNIRWAARAGADILFVPASDWEAITPLHTQMAGFRALENGFSVVRVAQSGLSAGLDYRSLTLAAMDAFTTRESIMMAHAPTRKAVTIYTFIGDGFAWLAIVGFMLLVGRALLKRER